MAKFLHYGGREYTLPADYDLEHVAQSLTEGRQTAMSRNLIALVEVPLEGGGQVQVHLSEAIPFAFVDTDSNASTPAH
jgi:hypothetical protein